MPVITKTRTVTIRVEPASYARLLAVADKYGVTPSEYIRQAIKEAIRRDNKSR